LPPTVESTVKIDPTFLSKTSWKAAELVSIDRVNHDSRVYKFALERVDQDLGLPCGMHVYARLKRKATTRLTTNVERVDEDEDGDEEEGGEMVMRAYTPVSSSNAKGFLELLIKVCTCCVPRWPMYSLALQVYHPTAQFPDGGKMSMGFEELKIGETVEFKGPLGSFEWLGSGMARWKGVERKASQIGMICGGSGEFPLYQSLERY
jgi:nitrate reductase (NAD(P)H)